MGVQIYTAGILGLYGIVLFKELKRQDSEDALVTLGGICLQLPIMGRVFGWW